MMLDRIQVANVLNIDMVKARILYNLLGDWMGSLSYMDAKVEIQFPPSSGEEGKRKGDHRISKFDSKRGCGGDRGRDSGQERGGLGGHHYVSDKHDPDNGWFHGVDYSDSRWRFSGE